MFICSSCGYEGNPDSAPACSLCGAKKPGAEGSKAAGGAPSKPSAQTTSDELVAAAKAVAESAQAEAPKPAKGKGAAAKPRRPEAGVIRGDAPPPLLGNAALLVSAFAGALIAYIALWAGRHVAPSAWTDALIMLAAAAVAGFLGRLLLAPTLEESLGRGAAETFGNLAPGISVLGIFVLVCVGFYEASTVPAGPVTVENAPGTEILGDSLAEHLALLSPAVVELRTKTQIEFKNGTHRFKVPRAKLKKADLDEIQRTSGLAPDKWAVCLVADPFADPNQALPGDFSVDLFLSRLSDAFRVKRDTGAQVGTATNGPKKISLFRTKARGGTETLSTIEKPVKVSDIATALPAGVPKWLAVGLGLPHESTSDQDSFVSDICERVRPED